MFVTWHNSSPELHIDPALALSRLHLHSEQKKMSLKPKRLIVGGHLRLCGVVVGGGAFRGMSTMVVTPPAAAAFVAVVNPEYLGWQNIY